MNIDLFQYHNKPEELYGFNQLPPKTLWELYRWQIGKITIYEPILKQSAKYSFLYAKSMKSRYSGFIPPVEDAVTKSARYSYDWAMEILNKKPFPKGEDVIAKSPKYAMMYAWYVIEGKWPKGEDAIAKDATQSLRYAMFVLGGRFEKGEENMKKSRMIYNDYLNTLKRMEEEKIEYEKINRNLGLK